MATQAPFTLPVEYLDEMGAIAEDLGVPSYPHIVVTFLGRLERERMARAVRLLVEAEPILGCRFEMTPRGAVWRGRADLDAVQWFEVAVAPDYDAAMSEMFRTESEQGDRNFVVRLMSLPDRDVIVMTFNHSVADGQGMVECLYQLAAIYNALADAPSYRHEINRASRDGFEWLAGLTLADKVRALLRDVGGLRDARKRFVGISTRHDFKSWRDLPRSSAAAAEHRVGPLELSQIARLARQHGATRYAVLISGFARAFVDFVQPVAPGPVRIMTPSNLRRFTPTKARPAIRNMVVFASVSFDPARHSDFATTLRNATQGLDRLKRGTNGAPNPVAVATLKHLSYRTKRRLVEKAIEGNMRKPVPPTFSHLGRVEEERVRFDTLLPDAIMCHAACLPMPTMIVTITEYRGLTLATGFQSYDVSQTRMQAFLGDITAQIPLDQIG